MRKCAVTVLVSGAAMTVLIAAQNQACVCGRKIKPYRRLCRARKHTYVASRYPSPGPTSGPASGCLQSLGGRALQRHRPSPLPLLVEGRLAQDVPRRGEDAILERSIRDVPVRRGTHRPERRLGSAQEPDRQRRLSEKPGHLTQALDEVGGIEHVPDLLGQGQALREVLGRTFEILLSQSEEPQVIQSLVRRYTVPGLAGGREARLEAPFRRLVLTLKEGFQPQVGKGQRLAPLLARHAVEAQALLHALPCPRAVAAGRVH